MSSDLGGAAGETIGGKHDLVRWFHEAATSKVGRTPLVGIESELLPADPRTGAAVPYLGPAGVQAALRGFLERGFADPAPRQQHVTRLVRGEMSINLEPGAQIEVSGSPFPSLVAIYRPVQVR